MTLSSACRGGFFRLCQKVLAADGWSRPEMDQRRKTETDSAAHDDSQAQRVQVLQAAHGVHGN
jgi:hypothetical protein